MTTNSTTLAPAHTIAIGDTVIAGSAVNAYPLTVERIETDGTFVRFNGMVDYRIDGFVTVPR